MPSSQSKIITTLRERRQIEADLQSMLTADSDLELLRRAQNIATHGPQVVAAIIANLDRADSRLLRAMGTVAALLDREEAANALLTAIRLPELGIQGRLGGIQILERYLGVQVSDELRPGLADAQRSELASLKALLAQESGSTGQLIEYVRQLDRKEPDVALAVIRALRDVCTPQAVELLRMMAQDVREEIGAAALQALGGFRLPRAAWALQTLVPVCGPALLPVAERLVRKLRFVGVSVDDLPQPPQDWRALISPVGGLGQQSVWFAQYSEGGAQARFLNVLLAESAGAVEAVGHACIPSALLPPRRPLGTVHDVSLPDGSGSTLLLEAHFDLGRRLVAEALESNRETQIPVAPGLRLFGPWLWGYAGAGSLPPRRLPEHAQDDDSLVSGSGCLLGHPAFDSWGLHGALALHPVAVALRQPGWDRKVLVRRLTSELLADSKVASVLHRRLTVMSEWLLLAGEASLSRVALATALAVRERDREPIGLVQALVLRDLEALLASHEMSVPGDGSS